ncbi:hypothetical protein ACQKFE_13265 [Stutzerimonas stutzeri]|uniref:hypothetical protein n=1 Tax=Stutzerimonas stutzeri TaxID=316 RepID=UPI003D01C609
MVIRLERPQLELDDIELVDRVVGERQNGRNREFFQIIHLQWRERVARYVAAGGNPEQIERWTTVTEKTVGNSFRNLYLSPQADSIQKPILDKLRERTLNLCPACGEDGTPNTLDHYLPKEYYPEFSVTTANLFPMCDICQGKKRSLTLSEEGERLFIHPYFDHFLDLQLIVLCIGGPFNAPSCFTLAPSEDLPSDIHALVARHLVHLDIEARYSHFFRDSYLQLLRLVRRIRSKGLDVLSQIELFRDMELDKSVNSWRHVFYDGVLRNTDLMAYLEVEADLPQV